MRIKVKEEACWRFLLTVEESSLGFIVSLCNILEEIYQQLNVMKAGNDDVGIRRR